MKKSVCGKLCYIIPSLIVLWLMVGPFPADNTDWHDTTYAHDTLSRVDSVVPYRGIGNLQVSFSKEDISTEVGQPLMGYTDRKPLESEGIATPCYVRALTVKAATSEVTIVSADMMILFDNLTEEIVRRSGLRRDELYFNATHTHSGPGGWAQGEMLEFFYGKYSSKYFERIVNQAVKAIKDSRQGFRPAEVGFASVAAPEWIENRIYDQRQAWPLVSALVFKEPGADKIIAAVTSYSAHGTVVRRETKKCSADYAGELCRAFEAESGAEFVLYLSGSMGDARPKAGGEDGAVKMGEALAAKLLAVLPSIKYKQEVTVCSEFLQVDIPHSRFALGSGWQLFPLFMRPFQPTTSYLSLLRIGDTVLAGWPSDTAGELASPLWQWGQEFSGKDGKKQPVNILLTSFNGSWRGYFTTSETFFKRNNYATRMMGFMGPWAGEYFTELTKELVARAYR